MEYRKFGTTGLDVSFIGFGGASIAGEGRGYGFGKISFKESVELLSYAKDHGINLFDTAPIYGFQESERRIGEAFKNCRDEVILATKSGISWHENKRVDLNNSKDVTSKMLHQSLRDLKTDYIDLYMVHFPDTRFDIREAIEVIERAREVGKVRFIGLCNTNEEDIQKAKEIAPLSFFQAENNYFNHAFYDAFIKDDSLGFMGWGSFDQGILTGRVDFKRKFDEEDTRNSKHWLKKQNLEEKLKKVESIKKVASQNNVSLLDFIIGYNHSFKNLSTMLSGFKTKSDLDSILKALKNDVDLVKFKDVL